MIPKLCNEGTATELGAGAARAESMIPKLCNDGTAAELGAGAAPSAGQRRVR
jgi:hypothetical protein